MAKIKPMWQIEVDPSQPEAEIANVIAAFIRANPGREVAILQTAKSDIEKAISHFDA